MTELTLALVGFTTLVLLIGKTRHRDDRITLSGQPGPPSNGSQKPTTTTASVDSLIAAGRKIEAIKRLRQDTGVGLLEAKEAVEAIMRGR